MSLILDIDHVGIAVERLDDAVEQYRAAFDLEPFHTEVIETQGVKEVLFKAGSSFIQLLEPLGPETPVGKFIAKRGPGMHHLGYRVDSVPAALERLKSQGVPLIDEVPRIGSLNNTIAFVHPKGFGGVLVELVEASGRPHGFNPPP